MKLLIVDDQPGVTEGLCHGVNWAQLGFSQVQAVNSVREARAAMLNTVPDVMLCDIEMPEETGLELFKWVKKQGFATRCIFLTAHAKFSYAQEAMHLGAFDYIIQPAPYSEISQVTARAVKDVQRPERANPDGPRVQRAGAGHHSPGNPRVFEPPAQRTGCQNLAGAGDFPPQ